MGPTVGLALRIEVTQQLARQARRFSHAVLVHDARAVHPDAVDADRVGGEARLARGQVEHAAVGPTVYRLRIEEEEVGVVTGLQGAALADAVDLRRMSRQPPR